jgi:hypothetical protein
LTNSARRCSTSSAAKTARRDRSAAWRYTTRWTSPCFRGASWTQLAALLRSLLAEGDVGDDGFETLGGIPSGDLFSVANATDFLDRVVQPGRGQAR